MAGNRIKGITIEIGGNTTKLTDSLKNVDKSLKDTQSKLKDVNKLLKLDPSNIELLRQKHDLLSKAVDDTKKRQEELKKALEDAKNSGDTKYTQEQQNALQRELIETTQDLKQLQDALNHSSPLLEAVSAKTGEWSEKTRKMSTAAAGLGAAMIGNAYSAALAVDDLNTLSKQTGFTVEELQKMQYASALVDVDFNTMTGSIAKLTKNMANGSDAFGKLGISVKDEMTGQLRDANTVWYETLWALSKVQNETERDALAMELFGKSAADLSGIVDDGGVALMSYGSEAEELGLILSQDNVDAANKFNDAMDQLKARTSAAFLEAGASLAETLVPALEKLVEVATKVLTWFANLDGGTQAFILTIIALVAAISPVLGIISALTGAAAALNVAMLPMIGTIAGIIAVVALVVAAGVALYQNWDKVKAAAISLWQNIQTAFQNILSTATTIFNNVRNTISNIVNNIKSTVSAVFSSIPGAISGAIGGVVGIVSGVFSSVQSTISSAINGAKDTVTSAINTIKGAFNFSWSLPPLRLPHISITGSFSLNPPRVPSFGISWYRKAYENAVMFTSPTVIPTMNGFKGFGDGYGSELVIGTNKLREIVGASGNNINVNVYAAPGMDETAVANAVALKLDRWLGERL